MGLKIPGCNFCCSGKPVIIDATRSEKCLMALESYES